MNIDFAFRLAGELSSLGVRELCLCAGARNSPLIAVLSSIGAFRKFHFFEERSAAFFALGRIKAEGAPVAVITTSGTAAAELLPATVEAHYSGLPLLLITADRPRRYRGTGAPQSIEQAGLFGPYAQRALDFAAGEEFSLEGWARTGPAHLNVCLEEPLLDRSFSPSEFEPRAELASARAEGPNLTGARAELQSFLAAARRPWVLVGALPETARGPVREFLAALGAPVYLEAQSGLREAPELASLQVRFAESVRDAIDAVLRIGGVPTLRFWRDLDEKRTELPLLSVSELPFSGSPRSGLVHADLTALLDGSRPARGGAFAEFAQAALAKDRELAVGLEALLGRYPRSEPGMVRALSRLIGPGARVYLGNSLPIREWDLVAAGESRGFEVGASRGANGIDGQVSTFLGFAREDRENWAVLGDLTALYDLPGPWILSQRPEIEARIAVINNGGGKIFSRLFADPAFQNEHRTEFEPWAKLWGMNYERWDEVPAAFDRKGNWLLELKPDSEDTARFWDEFDRLGRR
ncbi:MAG: 2-succinyl-5-enolpyruvyl-6-hydroxy-3-cyclohexene-1-carboxylic-acid synthase [Oligoflexia bacterium]|nr:2-succinyl-5-enolpyruvyl-6-hydroxy-3-cyclohexene-1-carboxylic-acid synthase [Oligoflexia bacterium]